LRHFISNILMNSEADMLEDTNDQFPQLQQDAEISFYNIGNFLYQNGWCHEALTCFRSCVFVRPEGESVAYGKDSTMLGNALRKIGKIESRRGNLKKALEAYKAAVHEFKLCHNMIEAGIIYNRIGDIHGAQGDLQNALEAYENALQLQRSELGELHVSVAETLHNIGVIYRHQEDLELALKCYKEALFILKENGDDDLNVARTINNIGIIYRRKGEYEKAMEYFADALRLRRRILGEYHPSVNLTLIHYAKTLRLKGDISEAKKFYTQAMK